MEAVARAPRQAEALLAVAAAAVAAAAMGIPTAGIPTRTPQATRKGRRQHEPTGGDVEPSAANPEGDGRPEDLSRPMVGRGFQGSVDGLGFLLAFLWETVAISFSDCPVPQPILLAVERG